MRCAGCGRTIYFWQRYYFVITTKKNPELELMHRSCIKGDLESGKLISIAKEEIYNGTTNIHFTGTYSGNTTFNNKRNAKAHDTQQGL